MEPIDEKCENNCLYNHYWLWLSFSYYISLEAVRSCSFVRNCLRFVETEG